MKMEPGDWIDANEIDSPETLEAVRQAVRDMGVRVGFSHGYWDHPARKPATALVLDHDGDLLWEYVGGNGRQIHVRDLISPKPKGHPAAEILREIAEVAEWHPRPWEEFEFVGRVKNIGIENEVELIHAIFGGTVEIRRKPRTRRIGNYDVPLPEREAPKIRRKCWEADAGATDFMHAFIWYGSAHDYRRLERGLIHLDPKSAETHGRALASLMQEDEE